MINKEASPFCAGMKRRRKLKGQETGALSGRTSKGNAFSLSFEARPRFPLFSFVRLLRVRWPKVIKSWMQEPGPAPLRTVHMQSPAGSGGLAAQHSSGTPQHSPLLVGPAARTWAPEEPAILDWGRSTGASGSALRCAQGAFTSLGVS